MTKKIVIIILALAFFISVDAQNEVVGGYVSHQASAMWVLSYWIVVSSSPSQFSSPTPLRNHGFLI